MPESERDRTFSYHYGQEAARAVHRGEGTYDQFLASAVDAFPGQINDDQFRRGFDQLTADLAAPPDMHLQEGGVIAEVHEGEAVIPLDSPEGQEALADAVETATETVVADAAADAIETAAEVVAEAQDIAEEAVADEVRALEPQIEAAVVAAVERTLTSSSVSRSAWCLERVNGNGNGAHDTLPETETTPEPEPEVAPENDHWFFRVHGRHA